MNRYLNGRRKNSQQGMVLVIALILLLLITLLGVSSARMSTLDVQVAGNTIFSGLVFQGAESGLGKIADDRDLFNVDVAATNRGVVNTVPATHFLPVETVTGGAQLIQQGTIELERKDKGLHLPNSSLFEYQIFRSVAQSNLTSTSARDVHTEGRALPIAPP